MKLTILLLGLLMAAPSFAQDTPGHADQPHVRVYTTLGEFVIELNPARAPLTVEAFLKNVESGFYEGTIFHRVVQGFIAQGGGYTPELIEKTPPGTIVNESGNGLSNMRGTIGMARTTEPHSATTQFYINLADNLDLNPRPTRWGYTVFGHVIEGMEVVDEIGHLATGARGPFDRSVPVETVTIERMELLP